jgi:hypothetical protein
MVGHNCVNPESESIAEERPGKLFALLASRIRTIIVIIIVR